MGKVAVGYARVSSLGQVDGSGLDRQYEAIMSCAKSKDMDCHHVYREEGVAGKTSEADRPAFQQMIADLLGNGCRTIIVESLDRLARQYDVQQHLATYMASKGLTLISANTGEDITAALMGDPMRRALVQIQGIFAELDKNLLIAKLRKGLNRMRKETGKTEGRKMFGFYPGEAETLKIMRDLRQSATYTEIADAMNEAGVKSRTGGKWYAATVQKILAR